MRTLYTTLLIVLLPFVLLRMFIRGFRDQGYWRRWRERFGYIDPQGRQPLARISHRISPISRRRFVFTGDFLRERNNRAYCRPKKIVCGNKDQARSVISGEKCGLIWLHAVSVGEVRVASLLLQRLIEIRPDHGFHITTTTPTGAEMVRRLFGESFSHSYFPYDLPWCVSRFLDRLQPSLVLMIETEIWPNLLQSCYQKNIPVCLLNARLSESSFNRYNKAPGFTRQTVRHISLVAAKSESDRERFIRLGVEKHRAVCPGNLKFDISLDKAVFDEAARLRSKWGNERKTWVAGSTHPGEDEIVLQAHKQVLQGYPDALLILAPRHPQRAPDIARLCKRSGLSCRHASKSVEDAAAIQVIIADQLGELPKFYALSDAAFVGGSLVSRGGQNPLEAAVAAVPVLAGPDTTNFTDVYQRLDEAGAVITINGSSELATQLISWFDEPDTGKAAGRAARLVVEQNRGAVNRTLACLPFMERGQSP